MVWNSEVWPPLGCEHDSNYIAFLNVCHAALPKSIVNISFFNSLVCSNCKTHSKHNLFEVLGMQLLQQENTVNISFSDESLTRQKDNILLSVRGSLTKVQKVKKINVFDKEKMTCGAWEIFRSGAPQGML